MTELLHGPARPPVVTRLRLTRSVCSMRVDGISCTERVFHLSRRTVTSSTRVTRVCWPCLNLRGMGLVTSREALSGKSLGNILELNWLVGMLNWPGFFRRLVLKKLFFLRWCRVNWIRVNLINKGWYGMFFACGIWCVADVSSVIPSSGFCVQFWEKKLISYNMACRNGFLT